MKIGIGLGVTNLSMTGGSPPPGPDLGRYLQIFIPDEVTLPNIIIPPSESLSNLPAGQFTVEFSMRLSDPESSYCIVLDKSTGPTEWEVGAAMTDGVPVLFFYFQHGTPWMELDFDIDPDKASAYEVSFDPTGNVIRCFIDGVLQVPSTVWGEGELDVTGWDDSLEPISIGKTLSAGTTADIGWIQISKEIVHTEDFTPTDFKTIPPDRATMVLQLELDGEWPSTTLEDKSGFANHGSFTTGARWMPNYGPTLFFPMEELPETSGAYTTGQFQADFPALIDPDGAIGKGLLTAGGGWESNPYLHAIADNTFVRQGFSWTFWYKIPAGSGISQQWIISIRTPELVCLQVELGTFADILGVETDVHNFLFYGWEGHSVTQVDTWYFVRFNWGVYDSEANSLPMSVRVNNSNDLLISYDAHGDYGAPETTGWDMYMLGHRDHPTGGAIHFADFRYFDHALTDEEEATLYNAGVPGTAPLGSEVHFWPLNLDFEGQDVEGSLDLTSFPPAIEWGGDDVFVYPAVALSGIKIENASTLKPTPTESFSIVSFIKFHPDDPDMYAIPFLLADMEGPNGDWYLYMDTWMGDVLTVEGGIFAPEIPAYIQKSFPGIHVGEWVMLTVIWEYGVGIRVRANLEEWGEFPYEGEMLNLSELPVQLLSISEYNTGIDQVYYFKGQVLSEAQIEYLYNLGITQGDLNMRTTVTLTNDQIKALPTTPVEIIPAPGVGKMIVPMKIILNPDFTVGYDADTTVGDGLNVQTGIWIWGSVVNDTTIGNVFNDMMGHTSPYGYMVDLPMAMQYSPNDGQHIALSTFTKPTVDDIALTISGVSLADFTGGDPANTLKVTVIYQIVDV